jgi:hypothetical protein
MESCDSHPFSPSAGLPQDSLFSLRRVSSSVLHVCGAKITINYEIAKKNRRKVLKNRNIYRFSFEIQNNYVILQRI